MLLVKKCQLFGLFRFGQNKTRNNAWRLCREKRNLFDYKKQNYSNLKKSHFSEGLTHAFNQKMPIFLFIYNWSKKDKKESLATLQEKKKPFFTLKNRIFPKNRIFSKGLTHAFSQKMPIFRLFRFGQNKTRNNTQWLCREKKPFFWL